MSGECAMAAPQDAVVTVSGSAQKFVTKKKKVLSAEEAELYELAQAAGIVMDQEVFKILVDLLKMNVAPLAVFQMLKSMCAGHRLTDSVSTETSSPSIQATHTEIRGKTKLNPPNTSQGQSERSSREGSSQRVPRQPSASRMQKSSSSGKSSGGSST